MIDLDAARRELAHPEGIPLKFGGEQFHLPPEFPLDVLDPFLADDFDLAGLIRDAAARSKDKDGNPRKVSDIVVETLFERPSLPVEVINTVFAAFEALFGEEQYARFKAQRPSIGDYGRLTAGLFAEYGVSLGEVFASPASSESDGTTPKQTSSAGTSSTPEASGDNQGSAPDSSE